MAAARSLAAGVAQPLEQRPRPAGRVLRQLDAVARVGVAGGGDPGAPAEHVDVQQRVRAEPVRAVHGHARHLAGGEQAGHHVVVVAEHLGVDVGRDAAHGVVRGRLDRDRVGVRLDAEVGAGELGDVGQLRVELLRRQVGQVEQHVVPVRPQPRPSRISVEIARATMSRGARSLMVGA